MTAVGSRNFLPRLFKATAISVTSLRAQDFSRLWPEVDFSHSLQSCLFIAESSILKTVSTFGFTFSFFDQYPDRLRQFSRWLQSFNCYAAEYKYVIFYPAFKYPELFENQLRPGTNKYEIRAKQSQGPALCFHIYGNVTSRNFSLKDTNLRCFHVQFYCIFRPFHVPLENTSI
jgi:hypothetical protein